MLNELEIVLFSATLIFVVLGATMTIGYIGLLIHELIQEFIKKYFPQLYYYDYDEEA